MFAIISLAAAAGAGIAGFVSSRDFTQRKLRFVDAAQSPAAPWIAGGIAAVVAAPIVAFLPLVGLGTALCLGAGVAFGVKTAQRNRNLLP